MVAGGAAGERDAETERLRALAAALGVVDRCRFVGQLGRDAAADLMRASDVVACTPWYEPFGIVPIEAMGCGVPVVGTAVGGLLDTVVDGVTGLLVEPRRPDLLATALDELLADAARRRPMGAAGAAGSIGCTAGRGSRVLSWTCTAPSSPARSAPASERCCDTAASHAALMLIGAAHDTIGGLRAEAPRLARWAELIAGRLQRGGMVLTAGNGGSATHAAHLAGELVGRFRHERRALRAVCMTCRRLHADGGRQRLRVRAGLRSADRGVGGAG